MADIYPTPYTWSEGVGGTDFYAAMQKLEDGLHAASDAIKTLNSTTDGVYDDPTDWTAPDGATPIRADRLNALEQGLKGASDAIAAGLLTGGAPSGNALPGALAILHAGLAKRTAQATNLVFTGSSTTAGAQASAEPFQYVNRLTRYLQSAFPSPTGVEDNVRDSTSASFGSVSAAPGVHVFNAAEGGTTSATYMTDGEAASIAALSPAMVLHMVGANDYATGIDPAVYQANVAGRIAKLQSLTTSPCVHVLVQSYPRYDISSPAHPWAEYGAALAAVAAAQPATVAFIDLSADYAAIGIPSTDVFGLMYGDHIHQYDEGHAFMADLLARKLGIPRTRQTGRVLVQDGYDRPDTTAGIGAAETGQLWGTESGTFKITSSRSTLVSGSGTTLVDCGATDVDVQVQLAWTGSGNGAIGSGVTFNAVDSNSRLTFFVFDDLSGWTIAKYTGGTRTDLATGTLALGTPAAGTVHTLRAVAVAGKVTGYIDGAQVGQVTLSEADRGTYKPNSKVGLRSSGPDALAFDNFIARQG